jgi:ubiquinone/menaquinone biosynthesis C-methylase UbiE
LERYRQFRQLDVLPPAIRNGERALLFQAVAKQMPLNSLLEIGCAYGQNFHLMSEMFPEAQLVGVDPDRTCIEEGNRLLQQKQRTNAILHQADGSDLSMFADNSFDVVCSSASLLYIGAGRIRTVMKEMVRVSRKAIVLLEIQHSNDYYAYQDCGTLVLREVGGSAYWVRDYKKLIHGAAPHAQIELVSIPNALWRTEHWKTAGAVITARLDLQTPMDTQGVV